MKDQDISIEEMEWLNKKLGKFSGSEIHHLFINSKKKGELFGVGAQTYIRTKAAEVLTMESKQQGEFKQTEWGKQNEHLAVKEFEKITGKKGTYYGVANPQFFEYGDHAGISPDWESLDGTEGADFKCPYNTAEHVNNLLLKSAEDLENLHYDYYAQAQMGMTIRKWKQFSFVSFDPRMIEPRYRIKILTIYPDLAWREEFETRLKAATEKLQDLLTSLDTYIAHYDQQLQTTLIQQA